MDDLVLRIGRLAYRNPGWTPACGDASLARQAADLAPDAGAIPTVLAAVHHATDTLTHIAVTDRRCVRQAAADHRALHPHPPAARGLRHPPPLHPSTALPRDRPAGRLPPRGQDLHRCHHSPRRPCPRHRSPISCSGGGSHRSDAHPNPSTSTARTDTGRTRRTDTRRQTNSKTRSCDPAAWRTPFVIFSSRNQPCCSVQLPSMRRPVTSSPKQPPRQAARPQATSRPALSGQDPQVVVPKLRQRHKDRRFYSEPIPAHRNSH